MFTWKDKITAFDVKMNVKIENRKTMYTKKLLPEYLTSLLGVDESNIILDSRENFTNVITVIIIIKVVSESCNKSNIQNTEIKQIYYLKVLNILKFIYKTILPFIKWKMFLSLQARTKKDVHGIKTTH